MVTVSMERSAYATLFTTVRSELPRFNSGITATAVTDGIGRYRWNGMASRWCC